MADRSALEAAAAAGLINTEQVGPLHDFLASAPLLAPSGEEDLRFIRNFHDVFLAIGILLIAVGLSIGISTFVSNAVGLVIGLGALVSAAEGGGKGATLTGALLTGACAAGAAGVMWALGESFARRRRLFLPAIAIVLSLTGFAVVAAAALYFGALLGMGFEQNVEWGQLRPEARNGILVAAAAFAIFAPAAFYARFRLPFSLGLAGAGAALFAIALCLVVNAEATLEFLPALYIGLGALLFFAGVAFDARDPARASRFSDNGFWLHFAAAPLILNGAFGLVGQAFAGKAGG
ncbi:MAG: hypothetical protein ABL864_13855, partial [Terricaulis sp.]